MPGSNPDIIRAKQGDTLDALLARERALGPEALDLVLKANPGLSAIGPILPLGTPVTIPPAAVDAPTVRPIVQLWD
ncbi:tail protein X [Sphingomonas sp. LT1P40]|uniref:tail protein X n=1 Tax=Alteristakelama amylovorans TaxID=3096166 RepID=UPI002FCCA6FC